MLIYALLSIGIILEWAIVPVWLSSRSFVMPLALHLIASLSLGVAVYRVDEKMGRRDESRALYWYALLLVVFFPLIGLGAALIIAISRIFGSAFRSGLYKDYENYLEVGKERASVTAVFAGLLRKVRSDVSFEPFVDIMRGDNIRTKERVIEKLSRAISRNSVKLLKEALKDPSAEVRFYAAGALLKLEGSLNERIHLVLKKTRQRGSARDFSNLGDLYRLYDDTGLIEKGLSGHYLSLSCDAYRSSLDIDTNQPDVVVSYAQCLMALKRYEKAKSLLDKAIHIWPRHNEIVFLRSEVYFQLGCLGEVSDILGDVDTDVVDDQRREILNLWKSAR